MQAEITNTSKAPQGVHTDEGLVFIAPGATRTVDLAEDYLDRASSLPFLTVKSLAPLDLDGDGAAGGSVDELDQMKLPALKALAKAEGVDLMGATKADDIKAAIRLDREAKAD